MTADVGSMVAVIRSGRPITGWVVRRLSRPVPLRDGSVIYRAAGFEVSIPKIGRVEIAEDAITWSSTNRRWETDYSPLQETPC